MPVVQSDFAPILIAEEFGFVGFLAILLLYFAITRSAFRIANVPGESAYRSCVAAGLGSLLLSQTLIITTGVAGLAPLNGIVLPFISAGEVRSQM
jgi:cell division protein FtsW (lipid II flippase)